MIPTISAIRPPYTVHSFVGSAGLNRVGEGSCSFREVLGMKDHVPAIANKILQSNAAVVQNTLIGIRYFSIRLHRPEEGWDRFDDFAERGVAGMSGVRCALA